MKHICPWALCLLLLAGCATKPTPPVTQELYAMDTVMQFTAYGDGGETALAQCEDAILDLENRLSRTRDNSEISQLNAIGSATLDDDTLALVEEALADSAATKGAFDCTIAPVMDAWGFTTDHPAVPTDETLRAALENVGADKVTLDGNTVTLAPGAALDLGGIAKGYAAAAVAEIFQANQIPHGMVSLGGNVYVTGGKPDGSPWRVGVQDPNNPSGFAGILSLSDGFAVTSGAYQRNFTENGVVYHHIIDPATGYSAQAGLVSTTIVSLDDATLCDALSTALYVMGEDAAVSFWRNSGLTFEMILVTDDNRVVCSPGLAGAFEVDGAYVYEELS